MQSRVYPVVGCVAKLDILITTQKAVISNLASFASNKLVIKFIIKGTQLKT